MKPSRAEQSRAEFLEEAAASTKPVEAAARDEVQRAKRESITPEDLGRLLGLRGLNWLITSVLDYAYPADIFGSAEDVRPLWMRNNGGQELDPGVKWAMLLRLAVQQVDHV